MSQYYLQPYVHLCVDAQAAILLDLRNDAYIGLDKRQLQALRHFVRGLHAGGQSWLDEAERKDALGFAETLVAKGLLTTDSATGKEATPIPAKRVEFALVDRYTEEPSAVRLRHVVRFLIACVVIQFSLKWRGLDKTVARIRRRKAEAKSRARAELRPLIVAFQYIRPFVYTFQERCLFDSLVLTEYLAAFGVFPTWIIGVQIKPFAAHDWVQEDHAILNSDPAFARRFLPILSI